MLLTELSELIENLFSKLLSQSITQEEYRQKIQEALNEYDGKIRQLKEVITQENTADKDETALPSNDHVNDLNESPHESGNESGDAKRVPMKLKIKPIIIS